MKQFTISVASTSFIRLKKIAAYYWYMSLDELMEDVENFLNENDYSSPEINSIKEDVRQFFENRDIDVYYVLDEGINSPEAYEEGTLDIVVLNSSEYISMTHNLNNVKYGFYKLSNFGGISIDENDQRIEIRLNIDVGTGIQFTMAGYENPQRSNVEEMAEEIRKRW